MIRRKHCHQVLFSGFYHDNFRMAPAFHVFGLGDPLGGNGFWMMQNLVVDFVFLQAINELLWYFQKRPPMQTITFPSDLYFSDGRFSNGSLRET
jgi:hypothetical protein